MANRFDYFVILAEMRTGSNFLEESINAYSGLKCWGEAYNPKFIGKPNTDSLCGVDLAAREADPLHLLTAMIEQTDGIAGFRFFHDHDPRILEKVLKDPRCAKIVLTRNPLESYVSRKIASQTGQWRLGDMKDAKTAKITFETSEFEEMLGEIKGFQLFIQRQLQLEGQTAFYINYEDIQDIAVVNGLARYIGVDEVRDATSKKTKVQNPAGLKDKVVNFDDMIAALADVDHFNLGNTPNFEPRRMPVVPGYMAAAQAPLLYQPVQSGPVSTVRAWLAALDAVGEDELITGFSQKTLRQWKRRMKGHRSFTVISHPVVRMHRAFCERIVATGEGSFPEVRDTVRRNYGVDIPEGEVGPEYTLDQHKHAFLKFAAFVKGNLNSQTSVRVDGAWASQSEVIRGFAEFAQPDVIIREEDLQRDLPLLARAAGIEDPDAPQSVDAQVPYALDDFYDDEVEQAVKAAYQRDYMIYGFKPYGKA